MKRLCISLLAFVLLWMPILAQSVQNGGFESLVTSSPDTSLLHWSMGGFGADISDDAHSGAHAVKVWNWYYYAPGIVVNGDSQDPMFGGGMPVTFNPDKLDGWYKYLYGINGGAPDSAMVFVYVYSHQNFVGSRDTIARETLLLGPAAEYTHFELPINYPNPGIMADTILIRFQSSRDGFCGNISNGNCLYLTLDDIGIGSATGLRQDAGIGRDIYLEPNPSNSGFKVAAPSMAFPCKISLRNAFGQKVFEQSGISSPDMELKPGLAPGLYIWELENKSGKLHSGKWLLR